MRFDDPENLIITGLGAALLLGTLLGPWIFGLPSWSRLGMVVGVALLLYGVAGLRRQDDNASREDGASDADGASDEETGRSGRA